MISANRIVFRGLSSQDFDLKTCLAFDSDSGETDSFLTREAVASESYRGEFKRIHNFKYTEVFSPQFTLIKNDFSDFTLEEERKVLKWLTGSSNASFISVYYDDSEVISWEALGGFTEISLYKLGNGRTVGILATFESAMPYALSPLKSVIISGGSNKVIDINTDEPESLIYPRVTIQQGSSVVVPVNEKITDGTKLIEGTVYKYEGDVLTNQDDEYYWLSSKWVNNAKITFFDGTTSTSYESSFSGTYDTEEAAIIANNESSANYLAGVWFEDEQLTDEIWDGMQWEEVEDGYIVGNFYASATTYDKNQEYFFKTNPPTGSSKYKKIDKTYPYINNIGVNETIYKKINLIGGQGEFMKLREGLYVKQIDETHPQVTISMTSETNVWHTDTSNQSDVTTTSVVLTHIYGEREQKIIVKNNRSSETIVLDGANKVTSSSYPNRILGNDFTWNWLSFVEGENTIEVTGNCTVTLEWREPIKCGEF